MGEEGKKSSLWRFVRKDVEVDIQTKACFVPWMINWFDGEIRFVVGCNLESFGSW